jgi:hypothetical protein
VVVAMPIPTSMLEGISLGGMGAITRALANRKSIGDGAGANVVLPLRGGVGALVTRPAGRRLVSVASRADAESPSLGLAGWLERMQARRSAVLVVPDRPAGVAIALRWRLSPERFRLAGDFDVADPERTLPQVSRRRAWHSSK